jgi:hypothetical protein
LEYLIKVNKDKNDSIKEQNKALRNSITSMKEELRDEIKDRKALIESTEENQIKLQKT